jgi:hypothetical protein
VPVQIDDSCVGGGENKGANWSQLGRFESKPGSQWFWPIGGDAAEPRLLALSDCHKESDNAMTLSADARRANLNEALLAFLDKLGDGQFCWFYIIRTDYPDVLPTTWTELSNRGLLKDTDTNVETYQFTPRGYITALKLSGRSDEQQFREGLGNLCRVLKGCLKDRTGDFALIVFTNLVKESRVSEAFAQNALDADLIRHVLGRIGARWDGDQLVRVPHDFGLTPT